MDENEFEAIKRHVAGAIVQHKSPFDNLKSYKNEFELSQEFINEWVAPYYLNIGETNSEWLTKLKSIKLKITDEVIRKGLGDFNWRTRQTGAFFAAITNRVEFVDTIGVHLLKSEVTYAGSVYCKVLASFNTKSCVNYLDVYLEYYLKKPDLWFDQRQAMEAIMYLDKKNGTNLLSHYIPIWNEFIKNKPYWKQEIKIDKFEKELELIEVLQGFTNN